MRRATVTRRTAETDITATLGLDGGGTHAVATGIGFLDHMLAQLARHGRLDLEMTAKGDLHIDAHHTTEDCGVVLGQALAKALGDKRGITRYGHALVPMDEALARVALDLSGRPCLVWRVALPAERLGSIETELFREWFHAFAQAGGVTLHVECLHGENTHHIVEACYKALARALAMAVALDPRIGDTIPSTKESL